MFRQVITVCLNPSLDVTVWTGKLDFEEPCVAEKEEIYPGGKGINVSRMLTMLGFPNTALCAGGEENLSMLRRLLEREGVRAEYLPVKQAAVRENLTLVLADGRILKVNRKGPALDAGLLQQFAGRLAEIASPDTGVVFAGSLPPGVTAGDYGNLIAEVRDRGIPVAVDTAAFSLEDYKKIRPFAVKPNRVELERIVRKKLQSAGEIQESAQLLAQWTEHVLVSLGGDGVLYITQDGCWKTTAPKVAVKSTVGAGDATLSGFLYGMGLGWTGPEALRFGTACGTASVCCDGTCFPHREQIQHILDQVGLSSL